MAGFDFGRETILCNEFLQNDRIRGYIESVVIHQDSALAMSNSLTSFVDIAKDLLEVDEQRQGKKPLHYTCMSGCACTCTCMSIACSYLWLVHIFSLLIFSDN